MFSFSTARRAIFGIGSASEVAGEVRRIGGKKIVLFTDSGITRLGLDRKLTIHLDNAGLEYDVWGDVEPEPTLGCCEQAVDFARERQHDLVVGLGGGSSMDVAKAAATMLTNTGRIKDYLGRPDLILNSPAKLILCPTTAGTGSEVSNSAVLSVPEEKRKYILYSPLIYADVAILDPDLTKTMPPGTTAQTGVDALCHAIEGYVSLNSSPVTEMCSEKAISLISGNLRTAYSNGGNMEAREDMLLASYIAGLSFANAGTALGHAVGYSYGVEVQIPHGLSVGITMPYVLEYNAVADLEKHSKIASLMGEDVKSVPLREAAFKASEAFRKLLIDIDLPTSIKEVGVEEHMIPMLTENVLKSSLQVARNPRRVTKDGMKELFERAFRGRLACEI